jgi:hypothetical protein
MAKKKDINDVTDEISLIMREVVEATEGNLLFEIANTLEKHSNGVKSSDEYLRKQMGENKALQQRLQRIAREGEQLQINVAKNIGTFAGINTAPLEQEIKKGTKVVLESSMGNKNSQVQKIYRLNKFNTSAQFIPDLRQSIIKATEEGIEKGIDITYKRGRKMGYREYMEMAVRTGIQQEIGEQQIEIAKQANIVFFVCDEFGDCADDHADYQGKIYYNADYQNLALTDDAKTLIAQAIKTKGFLSVQEVRDDAPYLTTRPNCRHRFIPISIDEAIGEDLSKVKQSVDSVRGNYRPENYTATQQQRAYERTIRNNKKVLDFFEKKKGDTKSSEYDKVIQAKRNNISRNQFKLRQLLQNNPSLSREPRRETRKILIKDLGVKYNLKNMKGQPPTPVTNNPPPTPPVADVNAQRDMDETVKSHYAMPEEKKVYIKQRYDVRWGDKPDFWEVKSKKYNFEETYNEWSSWLKSLDENYDQDDEKYDFRKKVAYLFKASQKHFDKIKLQYGEGEYSSGKNTIEFETLNVTNNNKYRVLETITHEFGHAFDYNIAKKIMPDFAAGPITIRLQLSNGRKSMEEIIRQINKTSKLPADYKRNLIENKIKPAFEQAINNLPPKEREVFDAGESFSQAVQKHISTVKPSVLLETQAYKKVQEFDKKQDEIKQQVIEEVGLKPINDKIDAIRYFQIGQRNLRMNFPFNQEEKENYEKSAKFLGLNPQTQYDKSDFTVLTKIADEKLKLEEEYTKIWTAAQPLLKERQGEHFRNDGHITQISDFLDALSLGRFRDAGRVRYGHGTKYYKDNTGNSEAEIFTHLQTLNMLNPNDYELLKKEFPEICGRFEDTISKSVNYIIDKEGVA